MNATGTGARLAAAAAVTLLTMIEPTALGAQPPAPVDHSQHQQAADAEAPLPQPLGLPMSREGSGTAWLPDASPMYAAHDRLGRWEVMLHGNMFVQYLNDGGDRGFDQFGSINWVMAMANRPAGRGRFGLNAMFSLEPATIAGCGYPDLLASGERCDGHAIVDQQHPHDLFMELAAHYERPLTESLALQIYGGPAGEPALGPVAYPHRVSALPNPLAPISHHWLDATHITFGVVTGGVFGRRWKAEASAFNGREPDEQRWDIDFAPFDSYSGRFWFLPSDRLAMQISAGHLREAEPGEAGEAGEQGSTDRVDVDRVTASATYHQLIGAGGVWASTVAWGRNLEAGEATHFVLAETSVTLADRDSWFGRVDVGSKAAHDLDVHGSDEHFTIAKLQAGYTRYFRAFAGLKPGLGATMTVSVLPQALQEVYGSRAPIGAGVFFTLRPAAMTMAPADPHAGHRMP